MGHVEQAPVESYAAAAVEAVVPTDDTKAALRQQVEEMTGGVALVGAMMNYSVALQLEEREDPQDPAVIAEVTASVFSEANLTAVDSYSQRHAASSAALEDRPTPDVGDNLNLYSLSRMTAQELLLAEIKAAIARRSTSDAA